MRTITRKIEFDAGHRIPDHASKCRNLHGHRYQLLTTFAGKVVDSPGSSDHGMIIDFYTIKEILNQTIVEVWDHAFLCWENDAPLVEWFQSNPIPGHKHAILPLIPTVENLSELAFSKIDTELFCRYNNDVKLVHVRLYETPNCWADFGKAQ